jgi:hypothetical protein
MLYCRRHSVRQEENTGNQVHRPLDKAEDVFVDRKPRIHSSIGQVDAPAQKEVEKVISMTASQLIGTCLIVYEVTNEK